MVQLFAVLGDPGVAAGGEGPAPLPELAALEDPLAPPPGPMRAWARALAPDHLPPALRLRLLLGGLISRAGLGISEVAGHTPAPGEALRLRRADCAGLAFTLVALAREMGIPAHFVLFSNLEGFERRGDLLLAKSHLAAGFGRGRHELVYDFGGISRGGGRRISDRTALAIFRSNRGAENLVAGDAPAAAALLREAVALDPDLSSSWINLGVALRRSGRPAEAETAYRRALALAPDSPLARLNLEALGAQLARARGPTASEAPAALARGAASPLVLRFLSSKEVQ